MDGLETFSADMGVYLGGSEVRMSEKLLHSTQIGTSIQKMSGKGMSKCMWVGHGLSATVYDPSDISRG